MSDKWVDSWDEIRGELILRIHDLAREKATRRYDKCMSFKLKDHPKFATIDISIGDSRTTSSSIGWVTPWPHNKSWAYSYNLGSLDITDLTELYELLLNYEKP